MSNDSIFEPQRYLSKGIIVVGQGFSGDQRVVVTKALQGFFKPSCTIHMHMHVADENGKVDIEIENIGQLET